MAPKPRRSAPDPPADSEKSRKEATSEEEEGNGGTGSETDSESELEESKQPVKAEPTKKPAQGPSVKKPVQAPSVKKPETPKPSIPDTSSDEDDSGSDSEPVTKPIANIKPIASKPVVATVASKSPSSKVKSSSLSLPTKSISAAGAKRPANSENGGDDGEGKDRKRLKKKPEKYGDELEKKDNSNNDSKKKPVKSVEESEKKGNSNDDSRKLFQRLWSEDDEIAILKGMVDYWMKKNSDPVANLDDFHEFIKKSLHIDVSRAQLQDKIRRLRKKYTNNVDKAKKGKERIFAKDHEQKTFEWSKKVWGKENSTLELKSTNGETKKPKIEVQQVEVEGNNKEGKTSISEGLEERLKLGNVGLRNSGIEEWIKENSEFVDEEKRAKMEKKWNNFKMVEGEFYAKKLELMLEETNLILDALKSSAT